MDADVEAFFDDVYGSLSESLAVDFGDDVENSENRRLSGKYNENSEKCDQSSEKSSDRHRRISEIDIENLPSFFSSMAAALDEIQPSSNHFVSADANNAIDTASGRPSSPPLTPTRGINTIGMDSDDDNADDSANHADRIHEELETLAAPDTPGYFSSTPTSLRYLPSHTPIVDDLLAFLSPQKPGLITEDSIADIDIVDAIDLNNANRTLVYSNSETIENTGEMKTVSPSSPSSPVRSPSPTVYESFNGSNTPERSKPDKPSHRNANNTSTSTNTYNNDAHSSTAATTRAIREQWATDVKAEALELASTETSSSSSNIVLDERSKMDFSMWTRNGNTGVTNNNNSSNRDEVLSWTGIKQRYSGLFRSTLAMGTAEGVYHCNGLMECLLRPDMDLKRIMAVVYQLVSDNLQLNCTFIQRSMVLIERPPVQQEVLLASLTSWGSLSLLGGSSASQMSPAERDGWDHIEIQVSVSKELQQRVLLLAFVKQGVVPMGAVLPTSAMQSMENIFALAKMSLFTHKLSLSSLYLIPYSAACRNGALDMHFRGQLEEVFQENMWASLVDVFQEIDDHIESFEATNAAAIQFIEPLYKQHNLDLPTVPLMRNLSDFPLPVVKGDRFLLHTLGDDEDALEDSSEGSSVKTDGMMRCLLLMSRLLAHLQNRYDAEYASLLQQKHDHAVSRISDLVSHRRCLLTAIAFDSHAEISQLGKTFTSIFQDATSISTGAPIVSIDTTSAMSEGTKVADTDTESRSISVKRPKSTAEIVKARLESYRNSIDTLTAPIVQPKSTLLEIKLKPYNVVLFYFSCFLSTKPGSLYITPYCLYFASTGASVTTGGMSALFSRASSNGSQQRECQPIKQLQSISIQPTSYHYKAIISSQSLKLAFAGAEEWTITPLYSDCKRIQQLVVDIQAIFAEYWN